MNPKGFFAKLKRRDVYKVVVAYAIIGLRKPSRASCFPARAKGRRLACLLAIGMVCSPIICQGAFFARNAGQFLRLTEEVSYRTDLPADASLERVMTAPDAWTSQAEKQFPLTKDPVQFWAKFDLPDVTQPRRVLLDTSPWENVDFFFVRDGRLLSRQHTGTLVPPAERSVQISMTAWFAHSGFAEIELLPSSHLTVFAHIATSQRYRPIQWLRFYLWDAEQVRAGERRDRLFQGIYLGIILFLAVYNLGLFFAIREASYLYYVIMELAGAVYWSGFYGLSAEYLWPGHPVLEYFFPWIALGISGMAALQFFRHYLATGKFFPRADTFIKWWSASAAGFFLVPFIFLSSPGLAVFELTIIGAWIVLSCGILLSVIIHAYIHHHPLARNAIAAMLCSTIGAAFGVGAASGVFWSNDLTIHGPQIGSCLAGIILSIGLGFRFRNLQMELAHKQLDEARSQSAHEREKRELIEEQSRNLEVKVRERTAELVIAQEKSDALLGNILPQAVIEELKTKGESEPRRYEEVSILFTDFSGFTETVASIPPKHLVQELDAVFRSFDNLVAEHGLEKIKTIGNAYMAAAGLPVPAADHAVRCVRAALALTRFIEMRNRTSALKWGLRAGVHTGAVVAGIVGKHKYAYDVWGDTVNIASRLESGSEVNRVNISAYTYEQVRDHVDCEYRGKLTARGKGEIDMYYVLRERDGADGVSSSM
jgi:class 3 adenylate cyclase